MTRSVKLKGRDECDNDLERERGGFDHLPRKSHHGHVIRGSSAIQDYPQGCTTRNVFLQTYLQHKTFMLDLLRMKLGCLLPLVAIVMIIGGGQNVYTSLKNRKVTEVEVSSLTTSKPDSEWLLLKGGKLDVMNATYTSSFGVGDAKEIYVPLVAPGEDSSQGTIRVLVLTKDPDLLQFTNDSRKLEKDNASAAQVLKFLAESAEKMRVTRDVEGLVQYGIEGGGKKERKIRGLYTNLSPDVIILEEGTKPSMMLGLGMLIGGLVLGFVLLIFSGKKGKTA